MRNWLRGRIPTEETMTAHPSLRWMRPLLRRPWLWQLNRRRVALGAGIGVFFGFMVPVLQIAGAAVFAVVLRANLPVAAVSTLISNPFTYAPIGLLAYQVGATLLGDTVEPEAARVLTESIDTSSVDGPGWMDRAKSIGKPLFLGLGVFAVVGGLAAWVLVHLAWTLGVWLKRRRRRRRGVGDE
jgi:uncharacterized protein (DUF2062 family)